MPILLHPFIVTPLSETVLFAKWCAMHILSLSVSLLGIAAVTPFGLAQSGSNADAYVATEGPIAKAGVFANIGPDGAKCHGASAGVVVASPSTTNPNYVYTWLRDSSLVFKMIIDQYTTGLDSSLQGYIDSFIHAEAQLQQTSNPSGSLTTGGLGEPKFNIDLSAFTGPWGRPQRDGPALRATALITYSNWLLSNSNSSFVSSTLWPMIKLDLDYVSLNWNLSSFDLWEEIDSSSFFTSAVQHRALREGIRLATSIGQSSAIGSYDSQADNVLCFLQSFWHGSGSSPYITANTGGGRSGIDVNTVLASIHTFDPSAGCDATTFQPCSDKALINLYTYVESFRDVYGLNKGIGNGSALATGRYPEDTYMGGNPWYLATFAVAEQLYDAMAVWNSEESLTITPLSQPFFAQFDSSAAPGTYSLSSSEFSKFTQAVKELADSYVALAAKYTPSDGGLAEQYDRNSGSALSAVDLTWSYASAITAFEARNGSNSKFASWGASGLKVPQTCATQSGGDGRTVEVTFKVTAQTIEGENIYITGSADTLERWSPENAHILSPANYPVWSVTLNLPADTIIQYKYIRKSGSSVTWEADPNNQFTTPSSGSQTITNEWH